MKFSFLLFVSCLSVWCTALKTEGQFFQKQFAQTMARLLGQTFTAEHPVAEQIDGVLK